MLILSRHIGEIIMVGDNVKIMVVGIQADKVRLGIEAPSNVPVHRKEVYDAIQASRTPEEKPAPQPYTAELPHPSAALKAVLEEGNGE